VKVAYLESEENTSKEVRKQYKERKGPRCSGKHLPSQATWEAEIRRISVSGQPRQKMFVRTHLDRKKCWAWWHTPVIQQL
jgi:hypothetical protein